MSTPVVIGVPETLANLSAFVHYVNFEVGRLLIRYGDMVKRRAKENLEGGRSGPRRIDTGFLQRTIYKRLTRLAKETIMTVTSTAPYSVHVHFGTARMEPNRYLSEALEFYRQPFIDDIKTIIARFHARVQGPFT